MEISNVPIDGANPIDAVRYLDYLHVHVTSDDDILALNNDLKVSLLVERIRTSWMSRAVALAEFVF